MFRLHRSDRLAMAVMLLAAILGVALLGDGTGDAVRALALTEVSPPTSRAGTFADATVPLDLDFLDADSPVTGRYTGWLSLEDGDVVYRVPRATVRARPTLAGERTLVGVRLLLARDSGTSWTAVAESRPLPIGRRLEPGGELGLPGLELRLEDVGARDLLGAWPVLVHEFEIHLAGPGGRSTFEWTYVHGIRSSTESLRGHGGAGRN